MIITAAVTNEEADKIFPGYKTHKPYLRTDSGSQSSYPHLSFPAERCESRARGREPRLAKTNTVMRAWVPSLASHLPIRSSPGMTIRHGGPI